jgi:UDP-2,3-diacylglucosamine hydrolase
LHLFIADTHFGRSDPAQEREIERSLISFLRSVGNEVESLFLVGDIFEHFIEYRHSIPKGFTRFMSLLAEWTDAKIPVHYFVGNHDPWHRDYFEQELGVRIVIDDSIELLSGLRVYVTHGDGLGKGATTYSRLKPILRHPLPVGIFTGMLPSDMGLSIAKWYSRNFRKTELNQFRIDALRDAAHELLDEKDVDAVIMGHSHQPELTHWDEGTYANPGSWFMDQTAVVIKDGKTSLVKWNGSTVQPYSSD